VVGDRRRRHQLHDRLRPRRPPSRTSDSLSLAPASSPPRLQRGRVAVDQDDGVRTILVTPSGYGHLHPLIPLARALETAGHTVTVATTADLVGEIGRLGLDARSLGPASDPPALPVLRRTGRTGLRGDADRAGGEDQGARPSRASLTEEGSVAAPCTGISGSRPATGSHGTAAPPLASEGQPALLDGNVPDRRRERYRLGL
jgi:hypothetical protein